MLRFVLSVVVLAVSLAAQPWLPGWAGGVAPSGGVVVGGSSYQQIGDPIGTVPFKNLTLSSFALAADAVDADGDGVFEAVRNGGAYVLHSDYQSPGPIDNAPLLLVALYPAGTPLPGPWVPISSTIILTNVYPNHDIVFTDPSVSGARTTHGFDVVSGGVTTRFQSMQVAIPTNPALVDSLLSHQFVLYDSMFQNRFSNERYVLVR